MKSSLYAVRFIDVIGRTNHNAYLVDVAIYPWSVWLITASESMLANPRKFNEPTSCLCFMHQSCGRLHEAR